LQCRCVVKPLPTKVRTSFDIPALLDTIRREGFYDAICTFADTMTIRNWMHRHKTPERLSHQYMEHGPARGYRLTLKEKK